MSVKPWDPWQELERLHQLTDQLWEEFLKKLRHSHPDRARIGFLPDLDMVETEQDYRLYLAVPGMVEEDIDLTVCDDVLVVRGEREPPYDAGRTHGHPSEWRYGSFERRIRLPQRVETTTLKAHYEAGVLTIVVTKSRS